MPLVSTGLTQSLSDLFSGSPGYPADAGQAARAIAAAYKSYAANALAGTTTPVALSLEGAQSTLEASLASAFQGAQAAGAAGLSALAAALDAAFVAFWLTPPVAFAAPPITGVVTMATPGLLQSLFSALFESGVSTQASAPRQASSLANLLDTWTRTVVVTNVPPPPAVPVPAPLT